MNKRIFQSVHFLYYIGSLIIFASLVSCQQDALLADSDANELQRVTISLCTDDVATMRTSASVFQYAVSFFLDGACTQPATVLIVVGSQAINGIVLLTVFLAFPDQYS